jgi:GNAT superfamily N-acetyltransferase
MLAAMDPTLREARLPDVPRLCALAGQLGHPLDEETARARWDEVHREGLALVLAEREEAGVVGWAEVRVEVGLISGRQARVTAIVVEEGARRHGVGRALLAWAERFAAAHGCAKAYLTTNVQRLEAHAFYERLGWARRKTSHVYGKDLGGRP